MFFSPWFKLQIHKKLSLYFPRWTTRCTRRKWSSTWNRIFLTSLILWFVVWRYSFWKVLIVDSCLCNANLYGFDGSWIQCSHLCGCCKQSFSCGSQGCSVSDATEWHSSDNIRKCCVPNDRFQESSLFQDDFWFGQSEVSPLIAWLLKSFSLNLFVWRKRENHWSVDNQIIYNYWTGPHTRWVSQKRIMR